MGYCREDCEYLTSRHNCKKYHKSLAYSSFSSKSLAYSSHERCSECEKDHKIVELETAFKEKWIPVEDRLPEKGREVMVTVEGYEVQKYGKLDSFTSSDVYIHGEWQRWNGVIAWMPLPEAYMGE